MNELVEFLKTCELFAGLTDFEIRDISTSFQQKTYSPNDWIVQEGEKGDVLYLVRKGSAEIVKKESEYGEYQYLGKLKSGDWFGEMALLEEGERSASIRALEETEVYSLSLSDLKKIENQKAFAQIISALAKGVSRRLRTADESLVQSLKDKLRIARIQKEIALLLIQILIFYALYVNFIKISATYNPDSLFIKIFNPIFISILLICGVAFLFQTHFSLRFFGLNLNNWKRNVVESFALTIPLMGIIFLTKWLSITYIPIFKTIPLFNVEIELSDPKQLFLLFFAYVLLVPAQEFITRGVLQGCFQEFFQGKRRVFYAILASNLIFWSAHLIRTFSFAIITFIFGLIWGWLYARQKSLLGPIISHTLAGIWVFFILGFDRILIY